MDLFTYYRSTSSYRVRIALALKGLDFTAIAVNLLRDGGQQHSPEFLAVNPQGRVPALRLANGAVISQSMAIIEYLEDRYPHPPLLSADLQVRAQQRALAALIAADIHPLHNVSVVNQLRGLGQDEQAISAWIAHWISQGLAVVEQMIGEQGFCFGTAPSMPDLFLLPQLYAARRFNVDFSALPRVCRVERQALALGAFQQAHPDAQSDKPE